MPESILNKADCFHVFLSIGIEVTFFIENHI